MCFETPEIPPQQTVVCESGFIALVSVRNAARIRAKVFHLFNIATDPNPSNDEDQVSVEILPEPVVSVPHSLLSYGLLGMLVLAGFGWLGSAGKLGGFASLHNDPINRLITATAISRNAILLTANKRLLAWKSDLQRQDVRL